MTRAKFFKRVLAYIIDVLIVSLAASIISMPFVNVDNVNELRKEINTSAEKYLEGKIDVTTYYKQASDINYEMIRTSGAVSLLTLFITILYFIVFQFYNKGQTLGKKLLKIKVINKDDKLTLNNLILRSLIINTIIFDMILLFIVFIGNKNIYGYSSIILETIQYVVIITTIIMVIIRKDGRGVHDFLGNTMVVED